MKQSASLSSFKSSVGLLLSGLQGKVVRLSLSAASLLVMSSCSPYGPYGYYGGYGYGYQHAGQQQAGHHHASQGQNYRPAVSPVYERPPAPKAPARQQVAAARAPAPGYARFSQSGSRQYQAPIVHVPGRWQSRDLSVPCPPPNQVNMRWDTRAIPECTDGVLLIKDCTGKLTMANPREYGAWVQWFESQRFRVKTLYTYSPKAVN